MKLRKRLNMMKNFAGIGLVDCAFAFGTKIIPEQQRIVGDSMNFGAANQVITEAFTHPLNVLSEAVHNQLFMEAQPYFALAAALLVGKELVFSKKDKVKDASENGAYGTAREATRKEILDKKLFTTDINQEGTLLARYGKKPLIQFTGENSIAKNNNVAVVGSSGSGKSAGYIIPNIINTKNKSIVVTDPKGEMYEKTAETKRKQGYEVKIINFSNMDYSDRYNPLDYIKEEIDIRRMAITLSANNQKQDFWSDATISLASALIAYVKYVLPPEQQHMRSVYNLLKVEPKQLEELFMELKDGHIAKDSYEQAIRHLEGKTRSSVLISTSVLLDLWKYDTVKKFTYTSDFDLAELGEKKMIVYVILPVAENQFRPISSMFFNQLFQELYRLAENNFGKLKNPVRLLLDEFANIGKIPGFQERLSTTRSLGIEVSIVIQDIGQLRIMYEDNGAEGIMGCCYFKLYMGTDDVATADYFSKLLGVTTKRIRNESANKSDKGSSEGESYSLIQRSLRNPDELRKFAEEKPDQCILIAGGRNMFLDKPFYFKFKPLKEMLEALVSRKSHSFTNRDEYQEFIPPEPKKEEKKAVKEKVAVAAVTPSFAEMVDDPEYDLEF